MITKNNKGQPLQIWAQSSDSCASAAMPDASRETGAVNYSGTPRELAQHLVSYIQLQENKVQHVQA